MLSRGPRDLQLEEEDLCLKVQVAVQFANQKIIGRMNALRKVPTKIPELGVKVSIVPVEARKVEVKVLQADMVVGVWLQLMEMWGATLSGPMNV